MAQDTRSYEKTKGTTSRGIVQLFGRHTTTTSGALSTTNTAFSQPIDCGYTLTKTSAEAGRYSVQLVGANGSSAVTAAELLSVSATLLIAAADTAYTTDKGLIACVRADTVVTDGIFLLQFATGDSNADAELEDGAIILLSIAIRNTLV